MKTDFAASKLFRYSLHALALGLLLLVFSGYAQPAFWWTFASQIWACF